MSPGDTVVTLTEKAASRLRDLIGAGDERARSLRIALVRTHCMGGRGFTYHLALDDLPAASDEVFEESGVTLYIDRAASGYLPMGRASNLILSSTRALGRAALLARLRELCLRDGKSQGAALDYVETPKEAGFKLENPNAIAKCPCGHHDIFE